VTLVQGTRALFPDAPTARGRRHLEQLVRARREGWRAAVVFIIQRADARTFSPFAARDPEFARALWRARAQGVEVYAYRCTVDLTEVTLTERVEVVWPL